MTRGTRMNASNVVDTTAKRIVTIIDRDATNAGWGRPGPFTAIRRAVAVEWVCPVCGGPRGEPTLRQFCEEGDWYVVHCWANPCGHMDSYANVMKEGEQEC